jgi:hypothetical protein
MCPKSLVLVVRSSCGDSVRALRPHYRRLPLIVIVATPKLIPRGRRLNSDNVHKQEGVCG